MNEVRKSVEKLGKNRDVKEDVGSVLMMGKAP
jgi:hypothetical protein